MALFHWDILKDRISWNADAAAALGLPAGGNDTLPATNRELMFLIDPAHVDLRNEALFDLDAATRGVRKYIVSYRLLPEGREDERGFMVTESGRWLPDAHGRPAHVFATIRRTDCEGAAPRPVAGLPAQMDPSSGLYCRSHFFKRLERFLQQAPATGQTAALLILSLRNYAIVFDAYGFEAADATYTEVARRISRVLRAGDLIARYGDNRIALLIHDCRAEDLEPALQRFLHAPCARAVETAQGPVWPVLSIGAVLLPEQGRSLTEAIACAEEALAEAENRPASGSVVYAHSSNRASRRAMKAKLANEIFDALRHKRFTLAFQPVVDATTGKPAFHEALLRVFNEEGEAVSASHMIPIAEELGLVRLIDLEVLELAIEALSRRPQGRISINVSATTVADETAFLERLSEHAETVAGRMVVEITESAFINDVEQVNTFIQRLHELECEVALDDFGAGYTSFRNLRDLDVDIVKIDGAFCESLVHNEQNQHFVRSLIDLACNTGVRIVAEWVESEEDARLLQEWGVHLMQGFLFGTPRMGEDWPLLRPGDPDETPAQPDILARRPTSLPSSPSGEEQRRGTPDGTGRKEDGARERKRKEKGEEERRLQPAVCQSCATAEDAPPASSEEDALHIMRELEKELQQLRKLLARMEKNRHGSISTASEERKPAAGAGHQHSGAASSRA